MIFSVVALACAGSHAFVAPHLLYRCKLSNGDHFTTPDSSCEGSPGAVKEETFGCTASTGTPLSRCFNGKDDHMCVTGTQCPAGYKFESNLGNMPPPASGDRTLYRCRDGADHFDTTDSNCEGQTVEGILGYLDGALVYSSRARCCCHTFRARRFQLHGD